MKTIWSELSEVVENPQCAECKTETDHLYIGSGDRYKCIDCIRMTRLTCDNCDKTDHEIYKFPDDDQYWCRECMENEEVE